MFIYVLLLVVSILIVTKSADWFLGAAEKVGLYLHLPRFIMGVILVGFGTSLPELTTGIAASFVGESEIAISNVLGSNIANILIIIGIATVVMGTIRVEKDLINIDLPLLISVTLFFCILISDGILDRVDGILLITGLIGYLLYSLFYKDHEDYHRGIIHLLRTIARRPKDPYEGETEKPTFMTYGILIASVVLLSVSSKFAVDALMGIVGEIGVAVSVISFFALAIGTSLPELVVSFKALKQGHGDLVVGNIIGSCMFNILLIGGVTSLITPQTITFPAGYWMIFGVIIATIVFVISGITRKLHIWEGATFLMIYAALATQLI